GQPSDSMAGPMLWLQATGGNQAVSLVVQTARASSSAGANPRPDANVMFDAIAADYPAIVSAMTFDDLAEWRNWLGGWTHNKGVDEALETHDRQYRKNMTYPEMPIADSRWLDRQAAIESRRKPIGDHAGRAKLDPQKILDDDVSAVPQWNVAPETRYREWAVQHFASKPLVAELTDRQEIYSALQARENPGVMTRRPHLVLWWGSRALENTRGKVTFADLQKIP